MENLIQRLGKVIVGDEEVTRESGLEEKEVGKPSMPSITWMSLQLEHARCAEIVAAANHLGLPILEQTAKVAIDHLSVIAKRTHNKNFVRFHNYFSHDSVFWEMWLLAKV